MPPRSPTRQHLPVDEQTYQAQGDDEDDAEDKHDAGVVSGPVVVVDAFHQQVGVAGDKGQVEGGHFGWGCLWGGWVSGVGLGGVRSEMGRERREGSEGGGGEWSGVERRMERELWGLERGCRERKKVGVESRRLQRWKVWCCVPCEIELVGTW